MTQQYKAAVTLHQALLKIGIDETWIVADGISIQCYQHETKKVMRIINSLVSSLDFVGITFGTFTKQGSYRSRQVIRKEGQPISLEPLEPLWRIQ